MDTYENEYMNQDQHPEEHTTKESPFADSPYECAVPIAEQPAKPKKAKKQRSGGGWKPLLVVVMVILACSATALGVAAYWQNQMVIMEKAMDNKFQALAQIYKETVVTPNDGATPSTDMTPGQVYASNVQAVVAVSSRYETKGGYAESFGSGFIISENGYVVTNYHVIDSATQITVITYNNETMQAALVGSDSTNDIALLKVEATDLPCVSIGSSDTLAVGDQVAAIGNPLGELTSTLTVGYISAKDRVVNTDGSVINMLQTDAAINSGNSGGPLFNMKGQVIGITTAKYSGNSSSGASIEGLGFAIPMDDVIGMFEDLMEYGYITGAYLGVYVRDVDTAAQSYGLPAGAYVEEAMTGMAAERAGIQAGDIIINLGGYDVASVTELTRTLRRFDANETTTVTVYRKGSRVFLEITLDEKPVETEAEQTEPTQAQPSPDSPNIPDSGNFDDWFNFFFPNS
ncbi:MAG: trypsin-like peptidase domain-containing protein [Oscillospiraceae bacterium]|nr:trypsin-like peptidase domain-containing protein [Oscillospiraceae bacterium]